MLCCVATNPTSSTDALTIECDRFAAIRTYAAAQITSMRLSVCWTDSNDQVSVVITPPASKAETNTPTGGTPSL